MLTTMAKPQQESRVAEKNYINRRARNNWNIRREGGAGHLKI
jgi:hypothetical protein